MGKIGYVAKRIFGMSLRNMFDKINEVHNRSGKNRVYIFFDMINCGLRYQAGYMDYALFEMYNLNSAQRKTVVTRGINNSFIKRFNDPEYTEEINDKLKFAYNFSDFLCRDWLDLEKASDEELSCFAQKHPVFMAKPVRGMCGKGIEKIRSADFDTDKLRGYLTDRELMLLEECVTQHPVMTELHPHCVNTCRVVTLHKDGVTNVVAAYLRIGNGKFVDNFNSGGMVVPVEEMTGEIIYPALDKAGNLYETHPLTGVSIKGFKVPMWEDVLTLVKNAGGVVPQVGLVGWDVAISENCPLLIEGNNFPGHDIYGLPPHRTDGIGVLPKFKRALGE